MTTHTISSEDLDLKQIKNILDNNLRINLSNTQIKIINDSRAYLEKKINSSEDPIYGVNTGFGSLHNIKVDSKQLNKLQENLIISHACGVGEVISNKVVKIMLLLKIISLSKGYSGVHINTINRLIFFYNKGVFPIIYSYGSLGASGDLAPLAHLSLPLIGKGKVEYKGKVFESSVILKKFKVIVIQKK